jgi:hypothetical protein
LYERIDASALLLVTPTIPATVPAGVAPAVAGGGRRRRGATRLCSSLRGAATSLRRDRDRHEVVG